MKKYEVEGHEPSYLPDGTNWKLVWSDEFDGTELDTSKWERCPDYKRQDLNNYWSDDMSYLDGEGHLVIEMVYNEERNSFDSGAVRTKGKFEQAYGYFEISCTLNNNIVPLLFASRSFF